LEKEPVSSKEEVVHRWFWMVEGQYPQDNGGSFQINEELDWLWYNLQQAVDEEKGAADEAAQRRVAKGKRELELVTAGERMRQRR